MTPCLHLAITRLANTSIDNYAIWTLKAPYPSGYVLHDCPWSANLSQVWSEWQQMFVGHSGIDMPSGRYFQLGNQPQIESLPQSLGFAAPYSSRLMQYLAISLWQWAFSGPILNCLERCKGIADGQQVPLRLRLEIRDHNLLALPWEIMQPQVGQRAISLSPEKILFSRTTSDVDSLRTLRFESSLNILLVLGEADDLQLSKEAAILETTLSNGNPRGNSYGYVPCYVDSLVQPTPDQLISQLESRPYNVFFYAGHGYTSPDGGELCLKPDLHLNGIELAQALTRTGVTLAVFNSCLGAQPERFKQQAMPYSSLAEVLIRCGVPAVLGMRDEIADEESLAFIQVFAQALRARKSIDEAVAIARGQLLTRYRYNQLPWTLPVLYMHPEFDGELIQGNGNKVTLDTTFPEQTYIPGISQVNAVLRSLSPGNQKTWNLGTGVTKIGRTEQNDVVIPEPSVSGRHAEIFYRNPEHTYYLQDVSSYGTWICLEQDNWQQIHRQEYPLKSGMQIRFGNPRGQTWEFAIRE